VGVVVGVETLAAPGLLGRTGPRDGSDAAIDDALPVDVLSEELTLPQGVLVYALPLLRLLLRGGLAVGLPVASAVRGGSCWWARRATHFFLLPTLRPKNETMLNERVWFKLIH
jgi:hypothetical protein